MCRLPDSVSLLMKTAIVNSQLIHACRTERSHVSISGERLAVRLSLTCYRETAP